MALIVVNIGVFFFELGLAPKESARFIYTYALVPAVYGNPELARQAGLEATSVLPIVTNTFMHGGYLHLIVNMWTLWLFGLPVEDRLGPWRFLLFYLVCGTAGSVSHLAFNLDSLVPALGASGAIAGVLGAFSRLHPRARVSVVQPIFFFPLIFQLPAWVFTAIWFAFQLLPGVAALSAGPATGGIAWWAHIGGFVVGLTIARWIGGRAGPPGPWST
ncbi:MAG: rhomboid family intramembrane serine protease [Rhodospirillales bacterium]